jgi:hypothetical protein
VTLDSTLARDLAPLSANDVNGAREDTTSTSTVGVVPVQIPVNAEPLRDAILRLSNRQPDHVWT